VAQNAGKLRDYYRIGKMLGSGKYHIDNISARTRQHNKRIGKLTAIYRCVRRGQDVRPQRHWRAESSQGSQEGSHGRG
jgi:hypothetical protein